MKNVDRVLLIEFQNKSSSTGDNEISQGTRWLAGKARQAGKPVDTVYYLLDDNFIGTSHYMSALNKLMSKPDLHRISSAMQQLTANSELILRGHGNAGNATLSKVPGLTMALFLLEMGLAVNCRINITSCSVGRGPGHLKTNLGAAPAGAGDDAVTRADMLSESSFARELIARLCKEGLRNEVHARVQNVKIHEDGAKTTRLHGSDDAAQHVRKQPDSKIIFSCNDAGFASARFAY